MNAVSSSVFWARFAPPSASISMTPRLYRLSSPTALHSATLALLAWLTLLSAVAWLIATAFWAIGDDVAPIPTPRHESDPRKVAALLGQRLPAAGTLQLDTPSTAPAATSQRHALVGLASGFGSRPGFALIESDGRPARAVLLGEILNDGHGLSFIGHDHVLLEKDGQSQRLTLVAPTHEAGDPQAAAPTPTPVRPRRAP